MAVSGLPRLLCHTWVQVPQVGSGATQGGGPLFQASLDCFVVAVTFVFIQVISKSFVHFLLWLFLVKWKKLLCCSIDRFLVELLGEVVVGRGAGDPSRGP